MALRTCQVICTTCSLLKRSFFTAINKTQYNCIETYRENIWEVNAFVSYKPDLRANAVGKLKTSTFGCHNVVGDISRHTDIADLKAGNACTYWAILAILSEVKALKEQVTTLKKSVELVDWSIPKSKKTQWTDDGDNGDSESLSTHVARLGSAKEQTKNGTKSLL